MGVAIHPLEHLGLWLTVRGRRVLLDCTGVHGLLLAILLFLCHTVLTQGTVVCRTHMRLDTMLGRSHLTRSGSRTRSRGASLAGTLSVRSGLLTRNDVDQEVEHVGLREGGSNVGALESTALVVFGMDPGPHRQLGDEDVTALGEQDGGFGGDHLDLGIGLHDFLDSSKRELVNFVVVVVCLEVVDDVLPVSRQDIASCALQTLVHLNCVSVMVMVPDSSGERLTLAQVPVYSSATGAYPCAES